MRIRLALSGAVLLALGLVARADNKIAVSFPKPDPEHALAFMKVYGADGHAWRVPIEDIEGAKQRIANDPAWAKWLAEEKKSVDRWAAKHQDHVEWNCGWFHDFVSPKDASHLTWTDEIPGKDVQFFHSPSDPHVEITPKLMAAWVFDFREKHAEVILRAARIYRLTGDRHFADWAAGQLDFYADNYLNFKDQKDGSRLWWQTLDVAVNLVTYADTVRLLGDYVTPEHKASWKTKFFDPQVALLDRKMIQIHNIANWHRCAAAVVGLVFGDEAMWKEALDGKWGFRRQMADGITSDYLWCEQSMGYNDYVVQATGKLATIAGLYGRMPEIGQELAEAENLMIKPTYMRFPDGRLPNPADAGEFIYAPDKAVYGSVYRVMPTTIGLTVAAAGKKTWEMLVDPPQASPRPAELPPVVSQNLESSQMAVLVSGPWQVYLHYGQWTSSHSQAEALHYEATFNGVDVTHDTGTVGYGSPMHKGYYTRGANHNVPLVDGEGEVPPEVGKLVSFSEQPASIEMSVPKYRPKTTADRHLSIEGNSIVDVVTVATEDGKAHNLGLTFQAQGTPKLGDGFVADSTIASVRPEPFGYWRDVKKLAAHDSTSVDVDYGAVVMRVTFATKGDFTVWEGSTPDRPPKRRNTFYLETTGKAASFTTTLAPVSK